MTGEGVDVEDPAVRLTSSPRFDYAGTVGPPVKAHPSASYTASRMSELLFGPPGGGVQARRIKHGRRAIQRGGVDTTDLALTPRTPSTIDTAWLLDFGDHP